MRMVAVLERGAGGGGGLFSSEHAQSLITDARCWATEMNEEFARGEALWSLATMSRDIAHAPSKFTRC